MSMLEILEGSEALSGGELRPELRAQVGASRAEGIQLAGLDIALRRLLVSGVQITTPLQASEDDLLLAGVAFDCCPWDDVHLGVDFRLETYVFAGDVVKSSSHLWRADPGLLERLRSQAVLYNDRIAEVYPWVQSDETYPQLQAMIWSAQAVRAIGPRLVGADTEEEAAERIVASYFPMAHA